MDPRFFRKFADLITENSMVEAVPPTNMQIDPQSTNAYATKILTALNQTFDNAFSAKSNQDGSITIIQADKTGPLNPYDPAHADNKYNLTPQNVSKVIDPYYNMFRQKGWRFDQPVGGQFTIAVPVQQQQPAQA